MSLNRDLPARREDAVPIWIRLAAILRDKVQIHDMEGMRGAG